MTLTDSDDGGWEGGPWLAWEIEHGQREIAAAPTATASHRIQRPMPGLVIGPPLTSPLARTGTEERRPTGRARRCLQLARGAASRAAPRPHHRPDPSPSDSRTSA